MEMLSMSVRVDNARRSPGGRLFGKERTFLGLNNSGVTDSKNNSSSGKRDTEAFQRVGFLIVGGKGVSFSTLESLLSWSLWKKTADLSLCSNFSQSSNSLVRLISRGAGQKKGPLLSRDF